MELVLEPIHVFCNPEGRTLEANKYRYVQSNINLEASSLEDVSKIEQQNQLCAVYGNAVQPQFHGILKKNI